MSQRDAGWLQLYAETNQEALDLHIQAFRTAERLSVPVMVCMDGFLLTHASERADIPDPAQVDAFLPSYDPRQVLDPAEPVSIGAMVGPKPSPRSATWPTTACSRRCGKSPRSRQSSTRSSADPGEVLFCPPGGGLAVMLDRSCSAPRRSLVMAHCCDGSVARA